MTIEFKRDDYDLILGLLNEALDAECDLLIFQSGRDETIDKLIDLAQARNNLRHTYMAVHSQ